MSHRQDLLLFLGAMVFSAATAAAQSPARDSYDVNFIGPPLADPLLQHAKETYVLFGCAYCHGVDLVPRGEATDLMRSPLVGRDVAANVIGPLLRAGIPQTAKLSPMPQFSDLSDQQIGAIASWIHYARRLGRYRELTEGSHPPGRAEPGHAYFDQACGSCHATDRDLAGVGRKYDAAGLRAQILAPTALNKDPSYTVEQRHDADRRQAREGHERLLENHRADNVADLVAYLLSIK